MFDFGTVNLNIERTVFVTRTITQRVTPQTSVNSRSTFFENLIDLFIEPSYPVKKCSKNFITFEIQNNTSVRRQVNIEVSGMVSDWFNPKKLSLVVYPKEREKISWEVNVPCDIKDGEYLVTLKVTTPGDRIDKELVLEVGKEKTASNLLAFIGGSFTSGFPWWLLLVILIIINILFWRKLSEEQKEIRKKLEITQNLQSLNNNKMS